MTLRDPHRDPARDSDPYEAFDQEPRVVRARKQGYSSGSMVGALIAVVVIIAAVLYAIQKTTTSTATGPSTTISRLSSDLQARPDRGRAGFRQIVDDIMLGEDLISRGFSDANRLGNKPCQNAGRLRRSFAH